MKPTFIAPYFGDYFLIGRITDDAMAETWLTRHERSNRRSILKIFRPGRRANTVTVRQLEEHAHAVWRLRHGDIATISQIGSYDGRPFVSIEYPEGGTLAEQLAAGEWIVTRQDRRRLQVDIARWMIPIARAVHHAHQHGVIHGHLTPADVFLDASGHPRVANFGLITLGRDNAATDRTFEQAVWERPMEDDLCLPDEITTATDIARLGAILFHLLTGQAPGPNLQSSVRLGILPAMNVNVDCVLERICLTSLRAESDGSYSCANEMANELERWLQWVATESWC